MSQYNTPYYPATLVPSPPSERLANLPNTSTEQAHFSQRCRETCGTTKAVNPPNQIGTSRNFNEAQSAGHAEGFDRSHQTQFRAQDKGNISKTQLGVKNALEQKSTLTSSSARSFETSSYPLSHIRQSSPQGLSGEAPLQREDNRPTNAPLISNITASTTFQAVPRNYYIQHNVSAVHALNATGNPVINNANFNYQRLNRGNAYHNHVSNAQPFEQQFAAHPTGYAERVANPTTSNNIMQVQGSRAFGPLSNVDDQFVSSRHLNANAQAREILKGELSVPMIHQSNSNLGLAASVGASRVHPLEDATPVRPLNVQFRPGSSPDVTEAQRSGSSIKRKYMTDEDDLPHKRRKTAETKFRRRPQGLLATPSHQPTQRCPAPYKVENGFWVCTYKLADDVICGRKNRTRDKRARDRHLGTHAAKEEVLIATDRMRRDEAVALEWVAKIRLTCREPNCNFRTEVWRTDNIRAMHYAECHQNGSAHRNLTPIHDKCKSLIHERAELLTAERKSCEADMSAKFFI